MSTTIKRGLALPLLIASVLGVLSAPPARPQTTACTQAGSTPESFGPTDISAATGNGRMSVGLDPRGTVTVLKWPSPSFYDQIKYRTTDRSEPRMGALPNEGSFLGLAWTTAPGRDARWRFDWLRDWRSGQRYADDDGDEVVSRFRNANIGLAVEVRDVVAHDRDALVRHVKVTRTERSRVDRVRVVAFANFNPVYSKDLNSPTQDWCEEEQNDDGGTYLKGPDVVVHQRAGTDVSTGSASSVAVAMAFDGRSDGHHVGPDTFQLAGGEGSAYTDAEDGRLSGGDSAAGQADAAMLDQLSLATRRSAATTVYLIGAYTRKDALSTLAEIRSRPPTGVLSAKRRWWRAWLATAKLPDGPRTVRVLAKRALITARQNLSRGLIVRSIATQAPHGVDWVRDGAFINRMLDEAGYQAIVGAHNRRYAALQATNLDKPPGGSSTPAGNWSEAFYADGTVGGSTDYEIDATGLGIWTLWDHYRVVRDRAYLVSVYEAIQLAAHYLSDNPPLGCRSPTNGLYCPAPDSKSEQPRVSLAGAQAIWLGLDSAARAAEAIGTDIAQQNAEKWRDRRNEIGDAISVFLDQECNCYTREHDIGGINLWPVGLEPYDSRISRAQADQNWRHVARAMSGRVASGGNEALAILGNVHEWRGEPAHMRKLRAAVRWVANVPTTDSTFILGQAWMHFPKEDGPVVTMVSQPNAWAQAAFYLAALEVFGKTDWRP